MNEIESLNSHVDALSADDYCETLAGGEYQCKMKYQVFEHDIQRECELTTSGVYYEAFYTSHCENSSGNIKTFLASYEPHCLGTVCDADETETLVENQIAANIHSDNESRGYNCSISYIRVVAFERVWTDPPFESPAGNASESMPPSETPTTIEGVSKKEDQTFMTGSMDYVPDF